MDLLLESPRELTVPLLLARGASPGKTLTAFAGVHGDEHDGVRAIFEVFQELDAGDMSGDFVAVPVANPPAFWSGTRTSPMDGLNMARVFPGDANGSVTQVLAHHLAQAVIAHADFFIDLHTAGSRLIMPVLVGYDARDARSRAAALAFGCPTVWAHPSLAPGRTISFASEKNIPWLYTEAPGSGRVTGEALRFFKRGLTNLLRHLELLPGKPQTEGIVHYLFGDGDIDSSVCASQRGFCVSHVALFDDVQVGQAIGYLMDIHGNVLERFSAPRNGVVVMVRTFPVVERGDPVFLLADSLRGVSRFNGVVPIHGPGKRA